MQYNPSQNQTSPSLKLLKDNTTLIHFIFQRAIKIIKYDIRFKYNGDSKTISFTLNNAQKSDAGNYSCVSDNGDGLIVTSTAINFIVVGKLPFNLPYFFF